MIKTLFRVDRRTVIYCLVRIEAHRVVAWIVGRCKRVTGCESRRALMLYAQVLSDLSLTSVVRTIFYISILKDQISAFALTGWRHNASRMVAGSEKPILPQSVRLYKMFVSCLIVLTESQSARRGSG